MSVEETLRGLFRTGDGNPASFWHLSWKNREGSCVSVHINYNKKRERATERERERGFLGSRCRVFEKEREKEGVPSHQRKERGRVGEEKQPKPL